MYDTPVKLVKKTVTSNEYGDHTAVETVREVFADERSVRQSEFYQAATVGKKPEIMFVLADYLDYQDESIVRFKPLWSQNELDFKVLRTFRNKKTNELEIVCERGIDR